jgi:hypothetical protein
MGQQPGVVRVRQKLSRRQLARCVHDDEMQLDDEHTVHVARQVSNLAT